MIYDTSPYRRRPGINWWCGLGERTQYGHGSHGYYLTTCSSDPTMRRGLHTNVRVGEYARWSDGTWAKVVRVERPDPNRDTVFVGLSRYHRDTLPAGATVAYQGESEL